MCRCDVREAGVLACVEYFWLIAVAVVCELPLGAFEEGTEAFARCILPKDQTLTQSRDEGWIVQP